MRIKYTDTDHELSIKGSFEEMQMLSHFMAAARINLCQVKEKHQARFDAGYTIGRQLEQSKQHLQLAREFHKELEKMLGNEPVEVVTIHPTKPNTTCDLRYTPAENDKRALGQ